MSAVHDGVMDLNGKREQGALVLLEVFAPNDARHRVGGVEVHGVLKGRKRNPGNGRKEKIVIAVGGVFKNGVGFHFFNLAGGAHHKVFEVGTEGYFAKAKHIGYVSPYRKRRVYDFVFNNLFAPDALAKGRNFVGCFGDKIDNGGREGVLIGLQE